MTPEQSALINKARRNVKLARIISDQGFHEVALSRAYYAMFYVAVALLDQEGLSFSSHSAVISAFGRYLAHPGKVPVELHRQLIEAQIQRTTADYDSNPNTSKSDAEMTIEQAKAFIAVAKQNLGGN